MVNGYCRFERKQDSTAEPGRSPGGSKSGRDVNAMNEQDALGRTVNALNDAMLDDSLWARTSACIEEAVGSGGSFLAYGNELLGNGKVQSKTRDTFHAARTARRRNRSITATTTLRDEHVPRIADACQWRDRSDDRTLQRRGTEDVRDVQRVVVAQRGREGVAPAPAWTGRPAYLIGAQRIHWMSTAGHRSGWR